MKSLHVFTIPATAKAFFDGQFSFLVSHGHEIHVVASPGDMEVFCKSNNVKFFPIDIKRSIDPIADVKSIKRLVSHIKKEKYDAIFGHTPKGALIAMIAGCVSKIPNKIYYRHGLIYTTASGLKRKVFKIVEQFTSLLATKIVNVSPSLSKLAVSDNLNSNLKQTLIGKGTCGGIDARNLFNPKNINEDNVLQIKKTLSISESDFVIGFCGRICNDKGINELVAGFKEFKLSTGAKAKLLLIGSFDKRDILKPETRIEIDKNVDIISTGSIPHDKLPYYYSLMNIFVFPSYREGFGMSVIEASAMEKPILVSKSHGCIDSIVEHETGEYIEINPNSISQNIKMLYDDEAKRMRLGKNGRRLVIDNYDYKILWPKILDFYNSFLS